MTTTSPPLTEPIGSLPPSEMEFRFYCSGFYKALRRYRTMIIIGWNVVAFGCFSFPLGWSLGRQVGIVEIVLSCMVIASGLAVVWQSISALESYTNIALPPSPNNEQHPVVGEVLEIMKDVDEGGWQEAYGAMKRMEGLQIKYGLQPFS